METSTASGGPAPARRRRGWPRRAVVTLLSVVGAALVLVFAALAYLATPSGGERLRRLAVEKANAAIQGTLAVEKLSLRGGHLVLRGVELRDPDGDRVASVSALEVRVRVAALLRKRIDVALLRIDDPEISIEQDDDGSDLQRAVALREPSPEKAKSQRSSLGIVLEDLEIRRGVLDVLRRSAQGPRHVHLDDLTARGSARVEGDALEARLEAGASFASPFEGPLHASLEATGAGARKDVRLSLQAGTARLAGTARAEDETHAHVQIESLLIPPEVARAFVPAYPLRAPVSLSGEVRRDADALAARVEARAGSATASAEADVDLATRRARRAAVAVRHVDLSELTDDGPASDVALGLTASGGGTSFRDLAGRLELSVPPSRMAGRTMGPVHVLATADAGEVQLSELLARLPGVRLEARGRASDERLALTGRLVASDLGAFSRTLGKLAGPNGLSVKGRGWLTFALAGSVEHPSVRLDASFPVLVRRETRADGLGLHVEAPDLKTPTGTKAHISARALALAPGKVFRTPRLDVDGTARHLTVDAALHGYAELSLHARASLATGGHRATLDALSVRYPEARWSLQAPVDIEARRGLLRIAPLTLRSGEQSISVRVHERKATLDGSLALESFDLAKLPKAFVDPRLGLGGVLDLHLHAKGRSSRPDLAAKLDLRGGRFKRYRNVQLRLDASYARDEAKGTLAANGEGVRLTGTFDVPVEALKRGRPVPVRAEFALDADLRQLPLRLVSDAGMTTQPIRGTLTARAHVAGTAASPRGRVAVDVEGLATERLRPVDARLWLEAGDALRGEMRAEQEGKTLFAAKASLGAAPGEMKDADRIAKAPLSLEATVGPVSLSELQRAMQPEVVDPAEAPPRIRGTLAGRLSASGTLREPRLTLRARVDGLGAERTPDGRVALGLDYRDAEETLDLLLRSQNGGELHASAAARLDLSYPAVTRARVDPAPVQGSLEAKDFDPAFLSNLGGALEKLGGLLYADARVSGTMGAPTVKGRVEWKGGVLFTHGSGDFTDIHLLATGDDERIELKELTAKSGSGTAKLSAVATRTGSKAFRLHAAADLDKLPVTSQGQVAATVSIRSTVDGEASPAKVTLGKVDIPEAHVQLPDVQRKDVQKLDDPPDVVLTVRGKPVRGGKATPAAGATAGSRATGSGAAAGPQTTGRPGTQVTMFVNAPRNLWIQGKDVNTEIGLSDGFRVEYASEPKVFGDVNVIRGRLDVFGRRFDFQRDSKVSFTGPVLQPDLDVTAAYKNEIEQVTVYLKVQGQREKLQLRPTSDPPLPETEIYTLLATGHTSLHHGSGTSSPSGEAASLVGSLAASQLKKTLSSKLPLDVLSIEAGDSGIAGSKLEAGTYVNDRLYLGFTGRLGADPMRGENSNEVDLEYQLSKHWSVNGSYGDAHAGGAGVTWRKDY